MYTGIIFIKFFKLSKCETTNACVLSISSKCKISPLLLFVFNGCCGFWFCVSTVTCILIRHLHRYCVELELLIKMIYVVKQRRETTTFSGLNLSPFWIYLVIDSHFQHMKTTCYFFYALLFGSSFMIQHMLSATVAFMLISLVIFYSDPNLGFVLISEVPNDDWSLLVSLKEAQQVVVLGRLPWHGSFFFLRTGESLLFHLKRWCTHLKCRISICIFILCLTFTF